MERKAQLPFGGGCGPAFRSGTNSVNSALAHDPLSLGFAVAFGTRNTLGNGCNFVVSAETMAMVKEHFIENYGVAGAAPCRPIARRRWTWYARLA